MDERKFNLNNKTLMTIYFSMFLTWVFAILDKGKVTYDLMHLGQLQENYVMIVALFANILGLLITGMVVKDAFLAKKVILTGTALCMIVSFGLIANHSILWVVSTIFISFMAGVCISSWGYFFKNCCSSEERLPIVAKIFIIANLLQIVINSAVSFVSVYVGFAICIICLILALMSVGKIDVQAVADDAKVKVLRHRIKSRYPMLILYVFIVLINVCVGLIYQVIGPEFYEFASLDGFYGYLIYAAGIYAIMRLSIKINRYYVTCIAVSLTGFAVIAFMAFDETLKSYLVVNTLTNLATATFDLFFWCLISEALDYVKNSTWLFGIATSASVLGIFLGNLFGIPIRSTADPEKTLTCIAIVVVLTILAVFPIVNKLISSIFQDNIFVLGHDDTIKKDIYLFEDLLRDSKLTARELQIAHVLCENTGTYKAIADELSISENTAKTHIKNIYSKLGVNSRAEFMSLVKK